MAIEQVKKELEFPPAHFYLEDIEEIAASITKAVKARPFVDPDARLRFKVGDKKYCDTIEDLKKLGGTWGNFEIKMGSYDFTVGTFLGIRVSVRDQGATFDRVLRLATTRERTFLAVLLKIPPWSLLAICVILQICILPLQGVKSLPYLHPALLFLFGVLPCIRWMITYRPTVVELAYSHDKSHPLKLVQDWGGKAIWIVVGVFLAKAAGWLWEYLAKHK